MNSLNIAHLPIFPSFREKIIWNSLATWWSVYITRTRRTVLRIRLVIPFTSWTSQITGIRYRLENEQKHQLLQTFYSKGSCFDTPKFWLKPHDGSKRTEIFSYSKNQRVSIHCKYCLFRICQCNKYLFLQLNIIGSHLHVRKWLIKQHYICS